MRRFVVSSLLALSACTTVQTQQATQPALAPPPSETVQTSEPPIDLDGLEHSLGLDKTDLGFSERKFNTCEAGFGFSSSHNCKTQYLAVVNFQLQCRDSNGTVSDVDYQVTPVVSDEVKWSFGPHHGMTKTDEQGFGTVRALLSASGRTQRLRLIVKGDFLAIQAQDVRRIVAPKEWCEHRSE